MDNKISLSRLNLGINYFLTFRMVAENGSFSKTSEILSISEGAVRHRVDTIEKYLGLKLLDRNGNGVKLTTPGNLLLTSLGKIDEFLESMESLRSNYSANKGENIKICGGEIAILEVLPRILKKFKINHRETEILVEASHAKDCITKLLNGEIDIAIVGEFMFPEFSDNVSKLLAYDIFETPLCLAVPVSNHLSSRSTIALNELKDEHIIRRVPGSATQAIVDKLIEANTTYDSNFRLEMGSSAALLQAVSMNLGVGIVSEVQAKRFSKKSKVRILKLDPPLNIKLKAVLSKKENGTIVDEFLDYLKKFTLQESIIAEKDKKRE